MKKLLSCFLILVLTLACLSACDLFGKTVGITYEEYENCAVFTFDNFPEGTKASFTLARTGLDEGAIHYRVHLREGALGIQYKESGFIHQEQPLGEFTAYSEMSITGSAGYVEGDKITITFESFSPVSGEIIIAFTEDALHQHHKHTGQWLMNESTHCYQYICGCPSPDIAELHIDANNDFSCDICGYQMSEPPTNHFLRNQAGCQWLNEITADDIAEIKMICSASGVAPGSLKNISSSTNRSPIERLFEEYYWLDTTPVAAEDVRVPGGSILTVQFILKDGTVKELTFDNEAYFDSKGNAFKPLYIPTFNDVPEFTSYYSFVSYEGTALVKAYSDGDAQVITSVCTIPMDKLEFIPFEGSVGAAPTYYPYYIHTEFGDLLFHYNDLFNVAGTGEYYQLVGKNLDELIAEYSGHYSVTMNDPEWLYEDLAPTYKAGDTVTVKIRSALDLGFLFLVNGEKIMPSSADGLYWEYTFTMPANDVVIDFKTYDGFLLDANYVVLIETFWMHDLRADYVSIRKYYGQFASGAIVAMIDYADYPCVVWEETVGNTVITYGDGNRILVLFSGEFYTLPAAYAAGYLTDADVAEIAKTHMEG